MKFPRHISMTIAHNNHKSNYEPIDVYANMSYIVFTNPEHKERCIQTDEIWEVHWHPDTPVGFLCVCAPTLDEAVKAAMEVEAKEEEK